MAASLAEHCLSSAGSVVVAHRLSCSEACGIFLDQGSNPCPLPWQADSYGATQEVPKVGLLLSDFRYKEMEAHNS